MYVLLGAHGNVTSRVAHALLQQGQPVRVVGRRAEALAPLQQLGAQLAVGDAQDAAFLARAFDGASAAYLMIPPDYGAPDMRRSQALFGEAVAAAVAGAVRAGGLRRVVNLSSVGADRPAGTGPIAGLHDQEQRLNALPGLGLLHLRPGYFMENHLHMAGAVAALCVYPSLESPDVAVPMIATADIAAVVVRELLQPAATGVLHLHAPRHYTFREAAAILGRAIGRPDLAYVQVEPAQGMTAMQQLGFSANAAACMAEMAAWLSAGPHPLSGPVEATPTTLEDFAPRFRAAFERAGGQ
jgi:uncharacterized protein YbjT (DUF2867 family)